MTRPTSTPIAIGALTVSLALTAVGLALLIVDRDVATPDDWGFRGFNAISAPAFAVLGALLAVRRPANPVGWLLLVAGVTSGSSAFAQEYLIRAVIAAPGSLPLASEIAWVNAWIWLPGFSSATIFVLLLFPNGRLLSPRWRVVIAADIVVVALVGLQFALRPGPLENFSALLNPLGLGPDLEPVHRAISPALVPLPALSVGMSVWSVLARARRAGAHERQQLKWIALSAVIIGLSFTYLLATDESKPAQLLTIFALATFPAAIAIGVLRHRLFDIDVIIDRVLVYGVLSAMIATSYLALILLSQAALSPVTGGSDIAVAASTLAVVALVQPLRRRIQAAVDRRFYRARYDAARTLDSFAARLRDEVDLETVRADLIDVIHDVIQPAHAGVWLREARR